MHEQSLTNLDQPFDVVVVGGGLAGLTAALTAARHGATVSVIDARSFGGRARSATRDGYTLNEGGHALYRGAGGWQVLADLGVRPVGVAPPLDGYRVVWDGEIAALPMTPRDLATTRLLSFRAKAKLARWFNDIEELAAAAGDVTLDEWLAAHRAGADVRKYLTMMCRLSTYAARPEHMPAAAMLRQLARASDGVAYLDGGWQSLVDQLVSLASASGVHLVDHTRVTAIGPDGSDWVLAAGGEAVAARSVVFAAGGPALAADLLGDDPAGWAERAGPVQRAACLDVGGPAGDIQFLLSADEPLYCSQHAPFARLAPDGSSLYSLMRYLHADDPNTAAENRAGLESHAARAGLPAAHARTVDRFLAAPVVTWGSPQVGVERPTGHELADRGLIAAGDWLGDRLLADASIVSGAAAGRAASARASAAVGR